MSREVRRVPLDFDFPLGQVWPGSLNPYAEFCGDCKACDRSGYSPQAKLFSDQWYGKVEFDPIAYGAVPLDPGDPGLVAFATRQVARAPEYYLFGHLTVEQAIQRESRRLWNHWKNQWSHHLIQADVDALIAQNRLHNFPGATTAEAVNRASLSGMGHDSINQHVCIKARCAREGVTHLCPECQGNGDAWQSKAHKALYDGWKETPVPAGEGYQLWETVSEGTAMGPVLASPEEFATWAVESKANAGAYETASYEAWLKLANDGWAPSGLSIDGVLMNGVEGLNQASKESTE
jgi:hypothetical protein